MDWTFFLTFLIANFLIDHKVEGTKKSESEENVPCQQKSFNGENNYVCVCNATYCDTLNTPKLLPKGSYTAYTSSKDGLRFAKTTGDFGKTKPAGLSIVDLAGKIKINRGVKLQKILGFGGAFTDAAGLNILNLPVEAQDRLLNSYYGKDGIGYTFGRVPMGGADFSTRNYTYNDQRGDVNLTQFALQYEDYNYKIPLIKKAIEMAPAEIRLFGSTWSSPPWTKEPTQDYKGQGWLQKKYWEYWANYFVKFLKAYKEQELDFWGVTTQNEPSTGFVPFYPFNTLGWDATWMVEWVVTYLGPILKGAFPNIKIITFDDNTVVMPLWMPTVMGNASSAKYIDGIGFHWYSNSLVGYTPISQVKKAYPDKFLLATEACNGFLPWELPKVSLGDWSRGEAYSSDILQDLEHGTSGWIDWNLALDPQGKPNWAGLAADAPIIVEKTTGEFYKQPMFYALGHASKFFQPDADVIQSDVTTQGLAALLCSKCILAQAVQNPDGSVAVYILNKSYMSAKYVLEDSVQGQISLDLKAKSMTTLIYV